MDELSTKSRAVMFPTRLASSGENQRIVSKAGTQVLTVDATHDEIGSHSNEQLQSNTCS